MTNNSDKFQFWHGLFRLCEEICFLLFLLLLPISVLVYAVFLAYALWFPLYEIQECVAEREVCFIFGVAGCTQFGGEGFDAYAIECTLSTCYMINIVALLLLVPFIWKYQTVRRGFYRLDYTTQSHEETSVGIVLRARASFECQWRVRAVMSLIQNREQYLGNATMYRILSYLPEFYIATGKNTRQQFRAKSVQRLAVHIRKRMVELDSSSSTGNDGASKVASKTSVVDSKNDDDRDLRRYSLREVKLMLKYELRSRRTRALDMFILREYFRMKGMKLSRAPQKKCVECGAHMLEFPSPADMKRHCLVQDILFDRGAYACHVCPTCQAAEPKMMSDDRHDWRLTRNLSCRCTGDVVQSVFCASQGHRPIVFPKLRAFQPKYASWMNA